MKKICAIVLLLCLILQITACGKTEKPAPESSPTSAASDNSNQTESVSSSESTVSIVPAQSQASSSPQQNTTSAAKKPATPKASPSKAQKTQAHKHSYTKKVTPATCTDKGYTTYTCSCGDSYVSDYVNPSHTYVNYVCTKCNAVDKAHAYEYLLSWVKSNGEASGEIVAITQWDEDIMFNIAYNATYDFLYLSMLDDSYFLSIDLSAEDKVFYYYSHDDAITELEAYGKIDAKTYTDNTPISCEQYLGDDYDRAWFLDLTRTAINYTLSTISEYIDQHIPGISLIDLGFKIYNS